MLLGRPGGWVIGKSDQFRRAEDIQRHVIGHGANSDSRNDQLQDQSKNDNRGEKSARGRNGKRAENIVEQKFRPVADSAHAAGKILGGNSLRGGHANAHRQIRGRHILGHARQKHGELAVALQFFTAKTAGFQMLANMRALFYKRGASYRIVQIARQLGAHGVALHKSSPFAACCNIPEFDPEPEPKLWPKWEPELAPVLRTTWCSWDVSAGAGVSRWLIKGSRSSFSARRPRRIRDFTVPTLHSSTSAISS